MDDYASIASYNKSLTNFGTRYAFMQESMKTQATTTATMQGQLTNIQQFCMAVGQQPPHPTSMPLLSSSTCSTIAVTCDRRNGGGHNNGGAGGGNGVGSFPQQPAWFGSNGASTQQPTCPPTPYKHWENWNYCRTHGGDIDDTHTSALCGNQGPTHNPNGTCANMMGGSNAGMHKTILPLACGCTPPPLPRRPQQQQRPQQCPPSGWLRQGGGGTV